MLLQKHLESTRSCLCFLLPQWVGLRSIYILVQPIHFSDSAAVAYCCYATLRKLRRPYLDIAITRDRFHLFDGSVVRIWIGSYFDPASPASNSDTELGVKETKSHAVDEG